MGENVWNKKENKLILIRHDEMYKTDKILFKKYEWLTRMTE